MGWEARQKEIDTLKAKLEEFVLCMEGTEEKHGLIELIDAYYYDSDVFEKAQRLNEETKLLIESKLMERVIWTLAIYIQNKFLPGWSYHLG